MDTFETLKRELKENRISREQFWEAMRQRHVSLRDYSNLIKGSDISSIEITSSELQITTSNGLRYCWSPEDLRSAPNVAVNYGSYESEESAYLLQACRSSSVAFDIGANAGWYTVQFASAMPSSGTVHAFEPVPKSFARLQQNIALNGFSDRVRANAFGLSDKKQTVTMYVPNFSGTGAASLKDLHPEEGSISVNATFETLDAYAKRTGISRIDLIKMDVEGAELMVLKGGIKTVELTRPIIFMELLRKWSAAFDYHPNDVIEILRERDYRCFMIADGKLTELNRMTDQTVQTNFFFLPEEQSIYPMS